MAFIIFVIVFMPAQSIAAERVGMGALLVVLYHASPVVFPDMASPALPLLGQIMDMESS